MFSFGLFSTRKIVTCWSKSSRFHQAGQGAGAHRAVSSVKKRRLRGDLIAVYSYLIGRHREDEARLLLETHSNRPRGNGHKLKHGKLQLESRKTFFFFTMEVNKYHTGCLKRL